MTTVIVNKITGTEREEMELQINRLKVRRENLVGFYKGNESSVRFTCDLARIDRDINSLQYELDKKIIVEN